MHHVRSEYLWDALPEFLAAEQFRQVVLEDPLELQVFEVHPQRDDVPCNAGRRQFQVVEPGDVVGEIGDVRSRTALPCSHSPNRLMSRR